LGKLLLSLVELGATGREVVARYHSLTKRPRKRGYVHTNGEASPLS
jgi:hypothetical protein